jgi:hypothetical protein
VVSEGAHLKECERDDGQDREDKDEHNDYEECVHCPPFVEPTTNTVVAMVKLPYSPCAFLVADESGVWSAGGGCADVVGRIDTRAKKLTAKLSEPHPVGLALAFGSVLVVVLDSANVDQIDPHTGRLIARLHVGGTPVRLAVGFGSIWVNDDTGRVFRIQPQG